MTTPNAGKYDCPNCGRLMIDACQTNCGHRFCKRCLERLFEEEKRTEILAKCPDSDCQAVLRADDGIRYFPDRCFQKEVRQQIVKCPLEKCEWVGEASRLEEHKYKHHPSFKVKPVQMLEATHVMVDIKHMEATQAIHHHLQKALGDVYHTAEVLGEAIHSQQHMDPIVRESADAKEQSAAHSTASLGQADNTPCLQKCSLIMKADKNFNLMMGEVEPELDTSALTQVDQDMQYGCSQQPLVMGVDRPTLNQGATGVGLSGAAACMQTGGEKPSKRRRRSKEKSESSQASQLPKIRIDQPSESVRLQSDRKAGKTVLLDSLPRLVPKAVVSQYTQTMMSGETPPPLPPKTRHRSSTTPQEQPEKLQSLNCSSPPSLLVGSTSLPAVTTSLSAVHVTTSFAAPTQTPTESCSCSMCERQLLEERRKLVEEKKKSQNMKRILKVELLNQPETSSQEHCDFKLRNRVFSVPTRNQVHNSAK